MDELGKVDEIIPDPLGDEKLRNLVMSQDHLHLQGLWAFGKVGKVGKVGRCSQILPKMMDAQLAAAAPKKAAKRSESRRTGKRRRS